MGMFDYFRVELALPGFNAVPPKTLKFQTKSLHNSMRTYVITATGELYYEDNDVEWVDDETAFFGGYIREIPGTERRVYLHSYHGDIVFYTEAINVPDMGNEGWVDYTARFTDGKLTRITMVEETA